MNSQEYLKKLKEEIDDINYKINNSKKVKQKIDLKRRLAKLLIILKLIYPTVVAGALTAGALTLLGNTPFYRDSKKESLRMKKEIDSLHNVSYECQYEKYDNAKNTISIVGTWKKLDNGLYERIIETYTIEDLDENKITELLNNQERINSIDELFDEKPIIKKEGKNKLNEDDLYNSPYLQAIIYSEDKNDIIVVKESIKVNILLTVGWVFTTILPAIGLTTLRDKIRKFNFVNEVELADKKYRYNENVEELRKNLELKESNYKTLVRKL